VDVCDCGRVIEQPKVGHRRLKCLICSPRRDRPNRRKAATIVQLPDRKVDPDSGLTGATKRALEEWGMLERWEGAAALAIALLIDEGRHGASGAAGNVRGHRDAMRYALEQSPSANDEDVIVKLFREN
jgi:hypothetical protein